MARYTQFEQFKDAASHPDNGQYERVWLRDCNEWMTVRFSLDTRKFRFTVSNVEYSERDCRDFFNLEMRVYGWVSTERGR